MPEDRSLDEFGRSDADTEPAEVADTDTTGGDSSPVEPDRAAVDDPPPVRATATWTTDGADCERCGERVERRWLDEGDRVCLDCKPW